MANSLALVRAANTVLGGLAPGVSARIAQHLFFTPHRYSPRPWEAEAEVLARRVELPGRLSALRWGSSPNKILAMHGWEGRATQWGPFAAAATRAGFELVALDAPAHGHSAGRHAHPMAFARGLLEVDRALGPFRAVVGHSMGGASVALALSHGLRAQRAVLIASPSSMTHVLDRFASMIGLSAEAKRRMFAGMEAEVGVPVDAIDVARVARSLRQRALVVHSRDDREVPASEAAAIVANWQGARLMPLDGLGHRRILRSELMMHEALRFLRPVSAAPKRERLRHASNTAA